MHPAGHRLAFLSAALAAVLALVLSATALAATSSAARTRVGASTTQAILAVGSSWLVSPGERRCEAVQQAQAERLGAQYAKMGLGEQTLTSGRISTDLLNQAGELIEPAGEGPAFFVRNEYLQYIDVTTGGTGP